MSTSTPVTPTVTAHQAQTRRCACCHTTTAAGFPHTVRAPVSYGPRVKAVVVYLLARQHIPVDRAREAMADLQRILRVREPLYRRADIEIDTTGRSVDESLAMLMDALKSA